ncbi:hypothetical protein COTS27_01666 [Spirochaetota bacterium]|nr:hypothetical protein COTS27_01666 [Spirochaetota bacterium]
MATIPTPATAHSMLKNSSKKSSVTTDSLLKNSSKKHSMTASSMLKNSSKNPSDEHAKKVVKKKQWRSFAELIGDPVFVKAREREFPIGASELRLADDWQGPNEGIEKTGKSEKVEKTDVRSEGEDARNKQSDEPIEQGVSRRAFLKTMMAPLALAGLSGCGLVRKPERKIYPYARPPEYLIPGNPLYFATTYTLATEAVGLLVESHEGRPTKIEGNAAHEGSKGKTKSFHQASLLDLYSPDRLQAISAGGNGVGIPGLNKWISDLDLAGTQGAGTGIVYSYQSSPTFYRLLSAIKEKYPLMRTYCYDAISEDNIKKGIASVTTTKTRALPVPDYEKADVVVSLDSDFLGTDTTSLTNQGAFAKRRDPDGKTAMNRLYQYESTYTLTGAAADHRFRMKRKDIELIAYRMLYRFYEKGIKRISKPLIGLLEEVFGKVNEGFLKDKGYRAVAAIVDDLLKKSSRAVIVAGAAQPPIVHALVAYMNEFISAPLEYRVTPFSEVKDLEVGDVATLQQLKADLNSKTLKNIINISTDPVLAAPEDLEMVSEYETANVLALAVFPTETTTTAKLVVPEKHYLETWSDAYSMKGELSLVQPLVSPLYADAVSSHELLARILDASTDGEQNTSVDGEGNTSVDGERNTSVGGEQNTSVDGERNTRVDGKRDEMGLVQATHGFTSKQWRTILSRGTAGAVGARNNVRKLVVSPDDLFASISQGDFILSSGTADELEVTFDADYSLYDGRFFHNAWMQELPDPITKITWENVAIFSYRTAEKYGVSSQDLIKLKLGNKEVEAPVWVLPGQADDSIALKLGYGQNVNSVLPKANGGCGFNAYALQHSATLGVRLGGSIAVTGKKTKLASVQDHWAIADEIFTGGESSNSQNGRPLYRSATLREYRKHPDFAREAVEVPGLPVYHERVKGKTAEEVKGLRAEGTSIYEEQKLPGEYQWGLTVDLNSCIGCNACVIACQAENNIPVVGKEMVIEGREMHWLRVDRYFEGDPIDARVVNQPILCMQCEQAPCEQVCPVAATVHSEEGLNDMVYNRCVGTRFCSNNCPYKVRRFNYLDYHGRAPHAQKRISSHIFDLFNEPAETLQMQFNPNVTVRMRGVMEKCTYCVQRINSARVVARNEKRKIRDGEIVTACEQACPSSSIVFGNIADKNSRVSRVKKQQRDYVMLEELNIKPRTSYGAAVLNPNPELATI